MTPLGETQLPLELEAPSTAEPAFLKPTQLHPNEGAASESTVSSESNEASGPSKNAEPLDPITRVQRSRARRQQENGFKEELNQQMNGRLGTVTLTRNRSTLISARWSKGKPTIRKSKRKIDVRVQRVFATGSRAVVQSVARIALGEGAEADHEVVRQHFEQATEATSQAEQQGLVTIPRRTRLKPRGEHYDLLEVLAFLRPLFEENVAVDITWGRGTRKRRSHRRQQTILLGAYVDADRLIRIHPALDSDQIPRIVLEAVVYHEMLHAVLPIEESGGRRCVHTREFRRRERQYPHFDEAEAWLEKHLFKLLA